MSVCLVVTGRNRCKYRYCLKINVYICLVVKGRNYCNYTTYIYNIYIYIYKHCTWRSATAVKTLVQECCEKSVLFFFLFLIISFIHVYIYIYRYCLKINVYICLIVNGRNHYGKYTCIYIYIKSNNVCLHVHAWDFMKRSITCPVYLTKNRMYSMKYKLIV